MQEREREKKKKKGEENDTRRNVGDEKQTNTLLGSPLVRVCLATTKDVSVSPSRQGDECTSEIAVRLA